MVKKNEQCHLLILQAAPLIKLLKTRLDHLNLILRKDIHRVYIDKIAVWCIPVIQKSLLVLMINFGKTSS